MIEDGENGYLIPLFDDDLFINKLISLMCDEEKLNDMGVNSTKIIKKFSRENICQKFYDFITKRN